MGILPSFTRRTCSSQHSLRWQSIVNIFFNPHLNSTTVVGTYSSMISQAASSESEHRRQLIYSLVQDMLSRIRFKIKVYQETLYTDNLVLIVSRRLFHTCVPRQAKVETALPVHLSICFSSSNLLLIVDLKYMNSFTTSNL